MKIRLWALALLIMLSFCATAQTVNVRVIVKNDRNETLQNITARAYGQGDTVIAQKVLTNTAAFSLLPHHKYNFKFTGVSFTIADKNFVTGSHDTTIIVLAKKKSEDLDVVVVTAKKPFVKQDDDKTVVDAETLAGSSTNAYEVLEKTPGTIVDQDGNVYLNGSTPATIYINGREVKLSATDVATLLKSLPANSISKVEILRNPSSKYDAASSGGIVNIVLKKGVSLGTNGSVDVSHFQGKYGTDMAGFSINNNTNKLNTYLTYNFTKRTNYEVLTSDRLTKPDTSFLQNSYTKYPSNVNYAGAGLDYQFNKKWSISYDGRMNANNNRSHVNNAILIESNTTHFISGNNLSLVNNTGPTLYAGNTVATKYKIDSAGSEWDNSFEYNYFRSNSAQQYDNLHIIPMAKTLEGDGNTLTVKNIFSFKSDVVLKLKNTVTAEAGVKINYSNSNNNAIYFRDTGMGRYFDIYQTNAFKYKENISAGYLQLSKTVAGFTLKPGVRLEHTDITGHQLVPADTVFSIKRTDLFPYVYLRHKLAKAFGFLLTGNAIYRKSITRPYYEALNPYPKYADQYTYDIGNPHLQPQFTTNYEFNITANEFPVFSIGLNDITDIFTSLTYAKGDTLFRTYDNLGTNKELYMRVVGGIPPGNKKYFFYAGAQMNSIDYTGLYDGHPFKYKRTSWNFFMFHNYRPTPTLNLSLNAWMRVNGVFNFFELKTFGSLNLTGNQSILKKKFNIILSVNDLLKTNKNEFVIATPGFIANGSRYSDTRKIGIGIKYNFGIKPKEEKKPTFEAPSENP